MPRRPTVVPFPQRFPFRTVGDKPIPDLANVLIALRHEPAFGTAFAFDEMQQAVIVRTAPPICQNTEPGGPCPRFADEEDVSRLQEWMQMHMPKVGREHIFHALELFARENPVHPLRLWLNTREDAHANSEHALRQPILENWLTYALDVPNDAYHREVGLRFAVAMVARIMKPGCQCDYMPVLEGPQGELKSQFCRALAGDEYFSDHIPALNSDPVRVSMHMRGKWLIEVSELAAFSRVADVETLKAFISRQEEIYTPKFGRKERREPRQCVFIGTTNTDDWIKDVTGGRRFWPIKVRGVDLDWLDEHKDQLFAEAVAAYHAGVAWWPDRNFERRVIAPQQERRTWHDAWEQKIGEFIELRTSVTVAEVGFALDLGNAKLGMLEQKRIADILRKAQWTKRMNGQGRMVWHKPE